LWNQLETLYTSAVSASFILLMHTVVLLYIAWQSTVMHSLPAESLARPSTMCVNKEKCTRPCFCSHYRIPQKSGVWTFLAHDHKNLEEIPHEEPATAVESYVA